MGHVVARLPWATIDVDLNQGRVFLQQRWRYEWHEVLSATPWTIEEKRRFHQITDRSIWGRWSNRIRLKVTGKNAFSRQFASTGVPINFDVRWVHGGEQWTVHAHKTPPGTEIGLFHQSVAFQARVIKLYTSKLTLYQAVNAAGVARENFSSTPHEFGHALGNHDEYIANSPHLADSASTMNVGREIRSRHMTLVLQELNKLMPGTVFAL